MFACALGYPREAWAFGDVGAFHPRILLVGDDVSSPRPTAPARWAWELAQRTSAPSRLKPESVRASDPALFDEPFAYWSGDRAAPALSALEISVLRTFFSLGGVLLVDDARPADDGSPGVFGKTARGQLARVLPEWPPIALGSDHVLFKTFYLVRRIEGRAAGALALDAIVRGGKPLVIFSNHDLGGALARTPSGSGWQSPVLPGGEEQRERAIRLAVNIAMYVLCSNYKDDQVHAPFLMRRRSSLAQ